MRKSFTTKIAVLLVLFVLAGGAMFAANDDAIIVNGKVAAISSLSLDDNETDMLTIDADTGLASTQIATATYYSNNLAGYTITGVSANTALEDLANENNLIPYTVKIEGSGSYDGLASELGEFVDVATPTPDSLAFTIKVSVADAEQLWAAGTYQDTLTFTLANN
jgi:hypothetical protein